jgi:hypothetical protein
MTRTELAEKLQNSEFATGAFIYYANIKVARTSRYRTVAARTVAGLMRKIGPMDTATMVRIDHYEGCTRAALWIL